MQVQAEIQKWGNGLGLRVSGIMRDMPHFRIGSKVAVEVSEAGLIIRKIQHKKRGTFPYTEAQLLAGLSPATAHAELLAKPLTKEFAPDVD